MKKPWIPQALHKYVPFDVLELILTSQSVRFTQPSYFNDPFEFFPAFHRGSLRKIIRRNLLAERETTFRAYSDQEFVNGLTNALTNPEVYSTVALELFEGYLEAWEKTMGIFCLTSDSNNILMWAHYADCFRGAVLTFDPTSSFVVNPNSGKSNLAKVGYRRKRPVVVIDQGQYQCAVETFAWKSPEWSYEKEYRMFAMLNSLAPSPANPDVYLKPLPPHAVTALTLGPKMPIEHVERVRELIAKAFPNAAIFQAEIDPFRYAVHINDPMVR